MATRRDVLGSGLATAAVLGCAGISAAGVAPIGRRVPSQGEVRALMVGEGIVLPDDLRVDPTAARRQIPIIPVGLAHSGYYELKRVLDRYGAVAGLSSGGSLFCIERIAWGHGMRLTRLHSYQASAEDRARHARAVSRLLSPAEPASRVPSYRPSQTDGLVHAWIMENSGSPQADRQLAQEFA